MYSENNDLELINDSKELNSYLNKVGKTIKDYLKDNSDVLNDLDLIIVKLLFEVEKGIYMTFTLNMRYGYNPEKRKVTKRFKNHKEINDFIKSCKEENKPTSIPTPIRACLLIKHVSQ